MSEGRGTAVRLAVLAAALLGLLAVVAVAGSAGVPWSGTAAGAEGRTLRLVGRLAVDAAVVALVVALFALFVSRMRRPQLGRPVGEAEEEDEEEARSRWARLVLRVGPYLLLAVIVLASFLFAREVDRHFPRGETRAHEADQSEPPNTGPALRAPPGEAGWVLAAAGAFVLLALGSAAATPAVRRRLAARGDAAAARAAAVAQILDDSIDDLRAEPDPRRAVVAAYARMEHGLEWSGHGRRPHEAPLEYLARVLRELTAEPGRVTRLTALFESAKFSHHPVGAGEKDEAIACLAAIRGELRGPA